MAKILVVEDDGNLRHVLRELLSHDYDVMVVPDAESALERIKKEDFSLLLTDLRLPGMSGLELIKKTREMSPHIVSIILTGHATIESAVEAMKHGAYNYLAKPFGGDNLLVHAKRALEFHDLRKENASLKQQVGQDYSFENIIGHSPAMSEVLDMIRKVSESSSSVLITGESGTGKELAARIIHYNSRRSSYPFIAINCGAIPTELIESELFGHEKGAFTGAVVSHAGRFERAEGGAIFLDEIGELPYALQVKLLRVLQEKEYERVGGAKTIKSDVRVMAATNRNLEELIEKKAFREDLYYRLNVIPIHIPALRERWEDIPLLVEHFLKASAHTKQRFFRGIEPEAM
ncbi:MAG: sigma-54-dependent Fis family transcriptional regulator, partial [Deltaproteobacteria bacterium]|nr:sigma-54-dependent Fis family transcriptional regulator [Deltaproteobacteria bacterium]